MELSTKLETRLSLLFPYINVMERLREAPCKLGDFFNTVDGEDTISYIPANALHKLGEFNPILFKGADDTLTNMEKNWRCAKAFEEIETRNLKKNFINFNKLLTLAGFSDATALECFALWTQKKEIYTKFLDIEELYIQSAEAGIFSCMTEYSKELAEFYANFEVKGIAFFEDEKMVARALFWERVKFEKKGTHPYLDRIYITPRGGSIHANLQMQEAIKRLAGKNGWVFREKYTIDPINTFMLEGKRFKSSASVTPKKDIKLAINSFFPYLDTFSGVELDPLRLKNNTSLKFQARDSDGVLEVSDNWQYCGNCDRGFDLNKQGFLWEGHKFCCEQCASDYGLIKVEVRYHLYGRTYTVRVPKALKDVIYIPSRGVYGFLDYAEFCPTTEQYILKKK